MKRTAAVAAAILLLSTAGCGSPGPKPTPSTEAEVRACMEEQGYPLDEPVNANGGTVEGSRKAAELCNVSSLYPQD